MGFLHPSERVMLAVLHLDPVFRLQNQAALNQSATQISPVSQAIIATPVASAHRLRISFSRNRLREVATPGIGIDVVRQVSELPLLLGVLISAHRTTRLVASSVGDLGAVAYRGFLSLKCLALFAQAFG